MKAPAQTPLQIAEAHWGADMPDWVRALAVECSRPGMTQRAVADKLDRSPAIVTQILRKQYAAAMDRIEERVRGVFMDGQVECPALGSVLAHECQDWRSAARTFNSGSPLARQMYRACRMCPRFTGEEQ